MIATTPKAKTDLWYTTHPVLVPEIADIHIAEMRHIQPLLRMRDTWAFQRIKDVDKIHPRDQSYLWNADPEGNELIFGPLNQVTIMTFHTWGAPALFKPSLAEVYASIRRFVPQWPNVKYFCLRSDNMGVEHVVGDCHWCICDLFGDPIVATNEAA